MNKLQQLLDQKAALDKEIEATRRQEKAQAIAKVKSLMTEYGLTASDLSVRTGSKAGSAKGGKVAAKYRDVATGSTWSGRGLQPKWLKAALDSGRKLQDFLI
jgi:DNA-binding protein H-NS